ncbi:alpha/beta hydrolase family protein [Paenibacillus sp. HB172176]|uniref:dienelactone hydrolase family protein n=1 Tax=Paenibacillus sp. HB172176 TaxID=2493690 RepID=UPI001439741C|nr:alpha/beta hydrolase family protein [Paenibacillus sp. HB172176]
MTWQGDQLIDRFYQEAAAKRGREAQLQNSDTRKQSLKKTLADSLGEFPHAEKRPTVLLEDVQCDGYTRQRVELTVVEGVSFAAYVLIPDQAQAGGNPLPGVIAVHGHGYGSRQVTGMLADGSKDDGEPWGHHHFAVQLVKQGMVVIAPDIIGFGERRLQSDLDQDSNAPSSCNRLATQLLMMGKTLTGLRVTELRGVLDYFASRSEVDSSRIGIVGFSGGSLISYVTAALDDRIQATVLIGFPNTFKGSIMHVQHCICNYMPGILNHAELPELMGLIAPRPLFLESGDRDPIFPERGFREALAELQTIYASEQATEKLAGDLFAGEHEVSGRRSFPWLKEQLI